MTMAGIYCIECVLDGKKYFGQGINVKKRMTVEHRGCVYLERAIKKYGKNNFKKYVVLYCEIEELCYYEVECVRIFHSLSTENGYNILPGGNLSRKGIKHSEKTKTIWKDGRRKRENHPNYGKPMSEEQKEKIRKSKQGKQVGKDNPNYGNHHTDNAKKKIGDSNRNPSEEKRQKLRNMGLNMSQDKRDKISKTLTGRKYTSSSSQYIGVVKRNLKTGKFSWEASVWINKRTKYLGKYSNEIDAAVAHDAYIIKNNINLPLNFSL